MGIARTRFPEGAESEGFLTKGKGYPEEGWKDQHEKGDRGRIFPSS